MADKINYTHGDTGTKPADGTDFVDGEAADPQGFDWYIDTFVSKINAVVDELRAIDSDGDGTVDEADSALTYKGVDIDTDGDGAVNSADEAASATGVFELDSDLQDAAGNTVYDDTDNHVLQNRIQQGDGSGLDADTVDGFEAGELIPTDSIVVWSGAISNIPTGWVLCDGNNGTPDLRDRFVVGAGGQYSVGATGGSDTVTLTESELASHIHDYQQGYSSDGAAGTGSNTPEAHEAHRTNQTASSGGDSAHENRPPYYALAYIMKV